MLCVYSFGNLEIKYSYFKAVYENVSLEGTKDHNKKEHIYMVAFDEFI